MHADTPPSSSRTWLSTVPVLAILLIVVGQGTAEMVQARMLAQGEALWSGYADLRYDPPAPTCDPENVGAAPAEAAKPAGGGDADLLGDLFGDDDAGAGPSAEAVAALKAQCEAEHARYAELHAKITPALKAYRAVDVALSGLVDFGRRFARPSLVLLLAICAATASALRAHIALRTVHTRLDARVSGTVQLIVNALAAMSCAERWNIVVGEKLEQADPWVGLVWAAGFGAMALVELLALMRPDRRLPDGGSFGHALLTVPLYAVMGLVASVWFLGVEGHPAGLAIFLDKLTEHAGLYLQVGLFVWAGMLLKRTRLAHLSFDVLRPWRMPPELLAFVVVVIAAVPTAYSGASGIFVMAAGAIIYDELRRAGARNELALAATAMSGSLGVVLTPCLLVVIVASLNKQVTTGELFSAGNYVFALTCLLFGIMLFLTRRNKLSLAPAAEAMPQSLAALRGILPYALVLVGTILFYGLVLNAWMDEHSSAAILLVILLAFTVWEAVRPSDRLPLGGRLHGATTETTVHIGALLALMALSIGFGGVVERSEIMMLVPQDLGGPWPTMALLVGLLVIVGMLMDPYGAVILVSATIAHVAYANGITPVHFWMTVLVAFELGYLTPPVALNHLLTNLVVGEDAELADYPADASFWWRHERVLLPVAVMGTALLLVAFVPLTWS